MSTSTEGVFVPEWDLADRLGKSLRVADVSVQQMADYLDVHRNTVSAWINGRTPPSTQTVRLWAMRTGVPYGWLKNGTVQPEDGPDGGDGGVRPKGFEPLTFCATDGTGGNAQVIRVDFPQHPVDDDKAA